MNVKKFSTLTLSLAAAFALAGSAQAKPADSAAAVVKASVDKALTILKDPKLEGAAHREARQAKLREVSDGMFDWTKISQRSLGVHWRKLNKAERKRFEDTFHELLVTTYLKQLERFHEMQELRFLGTKPQGKNTEVRYRLRLKSQEVIPIEFLVNSDKKVVDVTIENVSLANHYRGSFNRILVNKDFDTMMKKLERKLKRSKRRLDAPAPAK